MGLALGLEELQAVAVQLAMVPTGSVKSLARSVAPQPVLVCPALVCPVLVCPVLVGPLRVQA